MLLQERDSIFGHGLSELGVGDVEAMDIPHGHHASPTNLVCMHANKCAHACTCECVHMHVHVNVCTCMYM